MAHRPNLHGPQKEDILTTDDLKQMREGLSRLSLEAVRHAYQTAYSRCRMVNDRVPSPFHAGVGASMETTMAVATVRDADG